MKAKMVTLDCGYFQRDFEVSHAERILRMKDNGGWRIPYGSEYKFENNGIVYNGNRKAGSKPGKTSGNK